MTVWVLFFYLSGGVPSPSIVAYSNRAECEQAARDYRPGAYACVAVNVPKRKDS